MRNIKVSKKYKKLCKDISEAWLYEWGSRKWMVMATVQWIKVADSEALQPGGKSCLLERPQIECGLSGLLLYVWKLQVAARI